MKAFIFGAGASKGAQELLEPLRPESIAPLINELFDNRYQTYADGILTADQFKQCQEGAASGRFEEWLTERWENIAQLSPKNVAAEKAFFAGIAFFLWNLLTHVTNGTRPAHGYQALLKKLLQANENFALISFNYDTLLDRAVQGVFETSLTTLASYQKFGLIKPHGSINWILPKRISDPDIRNNSFEYAQRLLLAKEHMFQDEQHQMARVEIYPPDSPRLGNLSYLIDNLGYCYPLIFMPLTSKQYDTVDTFANSVISSGKDWLRQADEIYMIGYRANDEIIKELLSVVPQGTTLHVVDRSQSGAEEIMTSVLGWSTLQRGQIFGDGFVNFVNTYR